MSNAPALSPRNPAAPATQFARKHDAIIAAATEIFLAGGYLGTNMDQIADASAVSKQTVYKHFASKEALFIEIVQRMMAAAGGVVHAAEAPPTDPAELDAWLRSYAMRQLSVVLTPRLLQLRRLVIGEVGRFPDLARILYEGGPRRAIETLTAAFAELTARGLLAAEDSRTAASHFNWLVMAEPLNQAMLLGDDAVPTTAALNAHVVEAVRVFLAAYGMH